MHRRGFLIIGIFVSVGHFPHVKVADGKHAEKGLGRVDWRRLVKRPMAFERARIWVEKEEEGGNISVEKYKRGKLWLEEKMAKVEEVEERRRKGGRGRCGQKALT